MPSQNQKLRPAPGYLNLSGERASSFQTWGFTGSEIDRLIERLDSPAEAAATLFPPPPEGPEKAVWGW